jgi:peroxiredoxin
MRYLLPILLLVLCVCAILILALAAGSGSGGTDPAVLDPEGDRVVGGGGGDTTDTPTKTSIDDPYGDYADYNLDDIRFLDSAESQEFPATVVLRDLVFVDRVGRRRKVSDFAPDKRIVLVVTRGNTTPICPFCSTQTADYVRRYDEIAEYDAEVILAYPVQLDRDRGKLEPFLADARERLVDPKRPIPFPVVFDVQLEAVTALDIRAKLAKPATYVIDREGLVRYAYVGKDWADRPSVTKVLEELGKLSDDEPAPAEGSGTRPTNGDGGPGAPENPDDDSSAVPPP